MLILYERVAHMYLCSFRHRNVWWPFAPASLRHCAKRNRGVPYVAMRAGMCMFCLNQAYTPRLRLHTPVWTPTVRGAWMWYPDHTEVRCSDMIRSFSLVIHRDGDSPKGDIYIHSNNIVVASSTGSSARTDAAAAEDKCRLWMRGGGLGSRPKQMYWEYLGDGVEYHLMSPTPRR